MSKVCVLVVGSGAREHALAWSLVKSPSVEHVYVAPGNGGTATLGEKCSNLTHVNVTDFEAMVKAARDFSCRLVVPGAEAPLVNGIVDYFAKHEPEILCFGPTSAAAQLEGSKAFSKAFMSRNSIPTAAYHTFTKHSDALRWINSHFHAEKTYPIVIKANGLAAGKGVSLPDNESDAVSILNHLMIEKSLGQAGDSVVIEERLYGVEVSILSLCDGNRIISFPAVQDHKRAYDGDNGPNTGGMGSCAPLPFLSESTLSLIHSSILQPTIDGMRNEGTPFTGCLFTGLILTENGPRVLEFNVRFGDPETQTVLALLTCDIYPYLAACCINARQVEGNQNNVDTFINNSLTVISNTFAVSVVLAAQGYPGAYQCDILLNLTPLYIEQESGDENNKIIIFHAATYIDSSHDVLDKSSKFYASNGGRILTVTATGSSLTSAAERAYRAIKLIHAPGVRFRNDIAATAIKQIQSPI